MIHEVFIYLRVKDGTKAIDFCKQAFGATEIFRLTEPDGRLGHNLMEGSPPSNASMVSCL
ncbi:MAG: hypothetical protein KDK37_19245 [Leptospiraceae bacterium]|nr:hypothetical protein [Leptospiraceae bacterium]